MTLRASVDPTEARSVAGVVRTIASPAVVGIAQGGRGK
jgi:hypothetical protein